MKYIQARCENDFAMARYHIELLGTGVQMRIKSANLQLAMVPIGKLVMLNGDIEHSGKQAQVLQRCGEQYTVKVQEIVCSSIGAAPSIESLHLSNLSLLAVEGLPRTEVIKSARAAKPEVMQRLVRIETKTAQSRLYDEAFHIDSVRNTIFGRLGVPALWRCRRVSRNWRRWVHDALAALPSPLLCVSRGIPPHAAVARTRLFFI